MPIAKYEGPIEVPAAGWAFTLTDNDHAGTTRTIPTGTYFWTASNGAFGSFLSVLKTVLDDGAGVTYTLSLDDNPDGELATGKLTITVSAGTFSITWTNTDLRDALGFTANIVTQTTTTSQNHVQSLWLPNSDRVGVLAPPPTSMAQRIGVPRRDMTTAVAPAGQSVVYAFSSLHVDTFKFATLKSYKVHKNSERYVNESLRQFYENVIGKGRHFRLIPDRTVDSVWFAVRVTNGQAFDPQPVDPDWVGPDSLWAIEYDLIEYVS